MDIRSRLRHPDRAIAHISQTGAHLKITIPAIWLTTRESKQTLAIAILLLSIALFGCLQCLPELDFNLTPTESSRGIWRILGLSPTEVLRDWKSIALLIPPLWLAMRNLKTTSITIVVLLPCLLLYAIGVYFFNIPDTNSSSPYAMPGLYLIFWPLFIIPIFLNIIYQTIIGLEFFAAVWLLVFLFNFAISITSTHEIEVVGKELVYRTRLGSGRAVKRKIIELEKIEAVNLSKSSVPRLIPGEVQILTSSHPIINRTSHNRKIYRALAFGKYLDRADRLSIKDKLLEYRSQLKLKIDPPT